MSIESRPVRPLRLSKMRPRQRVVVTVVQKTAPAATEAKEPTISRKDIISLLISVAALIIALNGAWFQFFRSESHLKLTVASSYHHLETKLAKFANVDVQPYDDSYSVGLLDDGNKDILIKSMTRTIYRIDSVSKEEDLIHGVLATAQSNADGTPRCPQKPSSELYWMSYEHEGSAGQQGALVIKADQFFTMNKLKFAEFFLPRELVANGETAKLLICFNIRFVKPNGTEGASSIPAATLSVKRGNGTPDSPDLLSHAGFNTLSNLQAVDK